MGAGSSKCGRRYQLAVHATRSFCTRATLRHGQKGPEDANASDLWDAAGPRRGGNQTLEGRGRARAEQNGVNAVGGWN
ncbi:hypothetical protein AAFF_G00134860 [Aldrovandia affinis]|uniref:Uncharacterized protein n=1 Tax=Aldrovandia affinis TaxID=143900 RepID=A0AAD7W901_9TELE|nr:hypothetical protein AAFF_G00134860 [Aldrovandia affinis]